MYMRIYALRVHVRVPTFFTRTYLQNILLRNIKLDQFFKRKGYICQPPQGDRK